MLGPEAPLVAIGGGLALLAIRRTKCGEDTAAATIIAAAGAAAAISAIFGNPLVAAVIFLEILGLGRRRTMLVVVPCLVASGVGALLFTGLGRWTGLEIGALAIPDLEPTRLAVADVVWALPLAAVIGRGPGRCSASAVERPAGRATLMAPPSEPAWWPVAPRASTPW